MKAVLNGLKNYLTNWKNLAIHSAVGILLLLFILFAPLSPYIRIAVLAGVVAFNIFRMKFLDK